MPSLSWCVSPEDKISLDVPVTDVSGDAISINHSDLSTQSVIEPSSANDDFVNFAFSSKGLHICNLNIRHILPKLYELRILLSNDTCPDIFGMCETFLKQQNPDSQLSVDGFNFIRKDRTDVKNKAGGGLLLYYRQSLHVTRRTDLEISEFETVWAEITLPNSKPFLICSVYHPPDACSSWIDLFDNEITKAQTTGLELILMGDFNIDYSSSCNNKWNNLVQLFDLSQLVSKPARVTASTATIIDHVYTTHKGNITEYYVPHYAISDHYPVCFTRKINHRIRKSTHI